MSESSKSKSDEYDPITDHHWREFEIRRLKGTGDSFQQLFEDIMVRSRPGFTRVRPYGNIGDRKCDGLFRSDSIVFQVYSPDELEQAKVQKKIDEDLAGAVEHWGDTLKEWVFVYNVKRGVPPDIPKTLQEKQKQYPDIKISQLSNDDLWEVARGLSLQQRSEILGVPSQLRCFPSDIQEPINWREICRALLDQWKGLTTNVLTTSNGVRFQLDEMAVPLGVVERRQQSRHGVGSGDPEQGSELYQEKITPISQDDFFEQVLRQQQSQNSQGKRIAIVGEPGSGKTTQLQKIGTWILEEIDGIPILIPLAALETKSLKEYLLSNWLQAATSELEIPQEYRDELGQLLKTEKVWLLLDGVDEMAIADALRQLSRQMNEGWVQNVRVILTCRLNIWDAGRNALDRFDVYRNLDFDYLREVQPFIAKYFTTEPELQQSLKSALEQPGKERIRDMVKNPLRLTLLCYSWQLGQGDLPETKAGLYEWFVEAFYGWNKDKVPVKMTTSKRKELNLALGELAKNAIDQESSRFRLSKNFVEQFLGDIDDENSLFHLALRLGWLNCVGVAEENPLERVYAFFHSTFQEYFAALAIKDWHFFLNHIPEAPDHHKANYRIFKFQWKEVILLWSGRQDIFSEQKEKFIQNLSQFKDECGEVYSIQAYLLAVSIFTEFDYANSDELIVQAVRWGLGIFDDKTKKFRVYNSSIQTIARKSLIESNPIKVVRILVKEIIIHAFQKPIPCNDIECGAVEIIGLIGHNNLEAIEALIKLITYEAQHFSLVRSSAAKSLLNISIGHQLAINRLGEALSLSQNKQICIQIASTLGKMEPGNFLAQTTLINLMSSHQEEEIRLSAAWSSIDIINLNAISTKTLNELRASKDEYIRSIIPKILEQGSTVVWLKDSPIEPDDDDIKIALETWENCSSIIELLSSKNALVLYWAVYRIEEKIGHGDYQTIEILLDELQLESDQNDLSLDDFTSKELTSLIIGILGHSAVNNEFVVRRLINLIKTTKNGLMRGEIPGALVKILQGDLFTIAVKELREAYEDWIVFEIIFFCAMKMDYPKFYKAWHDHT
jgi:adenylate kinase family enzyme